MTLESGLSPSDFRELVRIICMHLKNFRNTLPSVAEKNSPTKQDLADLDCVLLMLQTYVNMLYWVSENRNAYTAQQRAEIDAAKRAMQKALRSLVRALLPFTKARKERSERGGAQDKGMTS